MADASKGLLPLLSLMGVGMGSLGKAFYKKYGKQALPIINEVMSQVGVEWGKIMQQSLPAKSLKAAGEQQKMMGSMMGWQINTLELTDDKIHFTMSHCPLGLEETSKELCEAMMNIDGNDLPPMTLPGVTSYSRSI